jgi:streptomycin 6-kinase
VILEARSAVHGAVVVKVVPPQEDGQDREAVTLTAWQGVGAVRLLDRDVEHQALLLRRLTPGTALDPAKLGDDAATRVLVDVASRLAVPPTAEVAAALPDIGIWGEDLDAYLVTYGASGPIDLELIWTAQRVLDRLLSTAPEPVLLHGDLHHDNVLRDGDAWVAIDPKGYVGDAASEPSQMFSNPQPYVRPLGTSALAELAERRLEVWAQRSDLDPWRVRGWAVVKSVLSDVWSVEDHERVDGLPSRVAWGLLASEGG